jgi:exopolyphosphatase / guanosine-5'-triphosphate,3'-diphosphate pyrophosphatase
MLGFIKNSLRRETLGLLVLAIGLSACSAKAPRVDPCVERRAIYDIGSGSTKLKVADVNFCETKILKVVFEESRPVDYASDHSRSSAGVLSAKILKAGQQAIGELQSEAQALNPKKSVAVMTGVFRKAQNANNYRRRLQQKFKFPFRIVTQELEARYGFESVRAATKAGDDTLVVWDIGGSTMQFITKKNGAYVMDLGGLASVSFKQKFIREVQKKNPKKVSTPNPIGIENVAAGVSLARAAAAQVKADLKLEIGRPDARVVGIGSVHRFSISGQTGKTKSYRRKDIQKILPKQAEKSDQIIGGEYAATDVTNLMLVAGYMEELAVERVEVTKANIQEGVLLSHDAWSK